jgi:tetratricopeptide (TPR) repeat protein
MMTIAAFPKDLISLERPWHPSVTIMNDTDHHHARDERSVYDIRELEQHLGRGWMTQAYAAGVSENVVGPSVAMTNAISGKVKWLRQNRHHNSHVIYRFRGYFYEPADVMRRFKVDLGKYQVPKGTHPSVAHPAQYMLAVDGRPITDKEKPAKLAGEITLRAGLHRFEIWATGWDCSIGFGRSVKVMANVDADSGSLGRQPVDSLVECPDSFFDPATFPQGVLTHRNGKATIAANDDGTQFNVKFASDSRTRLLNLVLIGQEGPVPALNTISLTAQGGARILPVAEDFAELNKNDTLEILTGDKVAVRYVDDRFVNKEKEKQERFLNVSFSDARFSFVFFEMRQKFNGHTFENVPYYERLLRFKHGKPLHLKVDDADMDTTDQPDVVNVVLESESGGKKTFVAKETGPSTAMFQLLVIPVPGTPTNPNEFQVGVGEKITATYRDEENITPGVAMDRYTSVENAVFSMPKLRVGHAMVTPIDYKTFGPNNKAPGMRGLAIGFATIEERQAEERVERVQAGDGLLSKQTIVKSSGGGLILPRWWVSNTWADVTSPPAGGIDAVHGQVMHFEFEAPHMALRAGSSVAVYVQTDAGREQGDLLGGSLDDTGGDSGFDISAPGTMKLDARLSGVRIHDHRRGPPQIPIYARAAYLRSTDGSSAFKPSTSIFGCNVALIAGFLPEEGVISKEEIERRRERKIPIEAKYGLVVQPGEKVHVGILYTDASGTETWLTGTANVTTHPVLDVMDEDYRVATKTAYAGESLYLRVVDLGADVSDASDKIEVLMQAKSGAKYKVELLEVDTHSGVFRADYELSYAQNPGAAAEAEYDVKREGFPVVYGDTMGARYADAKGVKTDTKVLTIQKGADGTIWPFSKKYDDADIAMRTQFSLAEAFLEMAKRHRKLGEVERANDEYERAKTMLEKAMDMFRDPDTRAHAEYLLGNLTQEEADTTEDPELKEDRYRAALSRYMRVTGSYADTLHASKAQFKIATVYERMNEPEIAAQEYVKLAYKFPDSEFLALSMARLGTHFQRKAASYEKQAAELLAKTEDKDAQFDGKAMQIMTIKEYLRSAEIFERLQERFPDHELAAKGGLRAGQAFMRAGENRDALNAFKRVFEHEAYDGPKIRSEAMYWAGMCYENLDEPMAAYSIYKRLTFDFPESKWASFARSQLSSDRLLTLEEDLELKRVEDGR